MRKKNKKREKTASAAINRLRTYIIWLCNNTDSRDDEPVRVKAHNPQEAVKNASIDLSRFRIGNVYTLREFFDLYPGWKGQI